MLEEADERVKGANTWPSLTPQNGESSMLRRILGANGGNSANTPFGRRLSWRKRKMDLAERIIQAEQAAIDAVLDPESASGMPDIFKVQKEPRRSSRFANLQKPRAESSQQPTPHDLYKTNAIISVKEIKQNEEQEETSDTMTRGEDGRPLKSLHWRALGQRHNCEGNSLNCEKCKRVLEVKKATERFEAKRAAKQILQESNSESLAREEDGELEDSIQRIKREERFCRNSFTPNARIVAQKFKTAPGGDVSSCFGFGSNSKWAQPVLSQMPKGVCRGRPVDHSTRTSTPMPVEEEFKIERNNRKIISCVSRLKLVREYIDDEPDFESEKITSWELGPRSPTDVVFTLPCVCEQRFAEPKPLRPRILLIDMTPGENEVTTSHAEQAESQGTASVRKLIRNKTSSAEWDSWHELEEKESVTFECDYEEQLFG